MSPDYESLSNPAQAQPPLNIGHLFAIGARHGCRPAPVEMARVLEIGCGDGGNLISMARDLPEARFVGVESSLAPFEQARDAAKALDLQNVRLYHAGVDDLAEDFGEFDYILAHGFYSRVSDASREAMWRVARGSLCTGGLLFVSYNVLPGWRQDEMLRDFTLLAGRDLPDASEGLERIWRGIELLASHQDTMHPLAIAAERTLRMGREAATRDLLHPEIRPFSFREVADAAREAGFRYIADALPEVRGGLLDAPDIAAFAGEATGGDPLLWEEYRDVLTLNPLRQSVFTPAGQTADEDA